MSVVVESAVISLATDLISCRSITPDDAGCQDIIAARLRSLGFVIEPLPFGPVTNLWARLGSGRPLFVFAGHTDVVPPGPEENWRNPPFMPAIIDGNLHGRGSADMKTAIAAMLVAVEAFVRKYPDFPGSIAFLITSDEEGIAVDGTVKVVEHLVRRGEAIDFCIVGESTCTRAVGDTVKNGRRGSLGGTLTVKGIQGHVAYPERASNPIHNFSAALAELCARRWDEGNEYFSPTTFQFSNLNSGTGADNVIPGDLTALFNFRFSSAITADELEAQVHAILDKYGFDYDLQWRLSGNPFLTRPGKLIDCVADAIAEVAGIRTELSTTGGTSDARFIAPTGAQVIELGLVNATIHKVDEHIKVTDAGILCRIYGRILELLLLES